MKNNDWFAIISLLANICTIADFTLKNKVATKSVSLVKDNFVVAVHSQCAKSVFLLACIAGKVTTCIIAFGLSILICMKFCVLYLETGNLLSPSLFAVASTFLSVVFVYLLNRLFPLKVSFKLSI